MHARTHNAVPGHSDDPKPTDAAGLDAATCVPPCPVETTIRVVGGRWKAALLHNLRDGPKHFGALRRALPEATQRMTTLHLRELERDGLIRRTVLPGPVTRVEYAVTPHGQSLIPVLEALAAWGRTHTPQG